MPRFPVSDSDVDQQLRVAIAAALERDPALGRAPGESSVPIQVLVRNARVKLTGSVATSQDRARVEDAIRSVTGVLSELHSRPPESQRPLITATAARTEPS